MKQHHIFLHFKLVENLFGTMLVIHMFIVLYKIHLMEKLLNTKKKIHLIGFFFRLIKFNIFFKKKDSSKLDSIQMEYSFLLTSQLDTQRMYFEQKLIKADEQRLANEKIAAIKVFF